MDKLRVLVVDDERVSRVTTTLQLEHAGYLAGAADDGLGALAKLALGRWDVVVTDIRMPRMDGIALLRRISADFPSVQVIVMTAHTNLEHASEAMRLGAVNVLTKPFSFRALEALLCELVELRASERLQSQ